MERIEHRLTVDRPVAMVYNQWTQFEEFPLFMEGVESVQQIDDTHLRWTAKVAGNVVSWQAEIIEQVPDQRIVWRSVSGRKQGGMVTFRSKGFDQTEVALVIEYEPVGVLESVGGTLGITGHRVRGDLERFKEYIERRPAETSAWRGAVHHGREVR